MNNLAIRGPINRGEPVQTVEAPTETVVAVQPLGTTPQVQVIENSYPWGAIVVVFIVGLFLGYVIGSVSKRL